LAHNDVCVFLTKYLAILSKIAERDGLQVDLNSPATEFPGDYFDLLPQNIMIDSTGAYHIIDAEWEHLGERRVGY
jgi:hypothetical protein